MLTGCIASAKPCLADRVRYVQNVQFMSDLGRTDYRAHPGAPFHGICWKIEHNRNFLPQNVNDMRPHYIAKPRRQASKILNRLVLGGIKASHPIIHRDQQGRRPRRKLACKRRLASGDLSTDQVQGGWASGVHPHRLAARDEQTTSAPGMSPDAGDLTSPAYVRGANFGLQSTISRLENAPSNSEAGRLCAALVDQSGNARFDRLDEVIWTLDIDREVKARPILTNSGDTKALTHGPVIG
jgi:hypothetical protein